MSMPKETIEEQCARRRATMDPVFDELLATGTVTMPEWALKDWIRVTGKPFVEPNPVSPGEFFARGRRGGAEQAERKAQEASGQKDAILERLSAVVEDHFTQQDKAAAFTNEAKRDLLWLQNNYPLDFHRVMEDLKDAKCNMPDLKKSLKATYPKSAKVLLANARLEDFVAYLPQHLYIFTPTRGLWPGASVNSQIPPVPLLDHKGSPVIDPETKEQATIPASLWLDQHRKVEQMTWGPGEPMMILDRLIDEGGWIERAGAACFNLYRPPTIELGDAAKAATWTDHVYLLYPDDADRIFSWLAFKVQQPEVKINHALVLGGSPRIGKDTILTPARYAVGPWNFKEVSPADLQSGFNEYVKSSILEHSKTLIAEPPEVLMCNAKHIRPYCVVNVTGVIFTTNYRTTGLYLPADDGRHDVMWSWKTKEEFDKDYFTRLHDWFREGGNQHVAAFLMQRDVSKFDPKAPPEKTAAFWDIANANDCLHRARNFENLRPQADEEIMVALYVDQPKHQCY